MNKKGFTLIELIITIALLAIIATISFVSITNIIKEGKVKNCETLVNNIKMATSEYVSDNRYGNLDINNFNAGILLDNKYLSGDIIDPFTDEVIPASVIKINVVLNDDYTFKSATITSPEVLVNCTQQ